jgi:hypothetical protein
MIGILADQHLREQRLGGHPAIDRPLRRRSLDHGTLAGPAAVARPADHLHPVLRRDDVEHLRPVFADDVQHPAAARAGLVLNVDHDLDPRQVRRQSAAVASGRWAVGRRLGRGSGRLLGGSDCSDGLLEILEPELQLIAIELLRAATELAALQLLDQRMELLDLGILRRQGGGKLAHRLLQKRRVGR